MSVPVDPAVIRLIGKSTPMHQLYKQIGRCCNTDGAVLLIGESGTGKGAVARAIHDLGRRAGRVFWSVDGKQMPESSDEELLGIDESHSAIDGTCYITNFTSLPAYVQRRYVDLHATKEFRCSRTGKQLRHDVRFIVATDGDIQLALEDLRLPADLFYDWNFLPLLVPPLRDRKDDLPFLAAHFIDLAAAELKVSRKELSPEAMERLRAHDWPGNLTELRACMRRALESCRSNYIRREHLPELTVKKNTEALTQLELFLSSRLSSFVESTPADVKGNIFKLLLPEMEQSLFQYALKKSDGNKNRAAQHLGLHRNTLNKKLQSAG